LNTLLQSQLERAHLAQLATAADLERAQALAASSCKSAEERVREVELKAAERVAEIESELRTAETVRRKLHNQVQELKGLSSGPCATRALIRHR
jgi:kinesin family protein C1